MALVLIDTNVLVYAYDFNTPFKQAQARQVLDRLEQTHNGRLSVQCLSEFINTSTHRLHPPLGAAQALSQVNLFIRMYPVFDLTPLIVMEAARGVRDYSLAYHDAQIWATALLKEIPTVFSEDFQDGQVLEGVHFVNPFAAGFEMGAWV
jgi:predicted nucleic acid-binding protein